MYYRTQTEVDGLCTFPLITSINIAGSVVDLSETVTTLGVNLNQTLNLQRHVNNLCKSSYYHLRALRHIRASLPDDFCFSLATALIQSLLCLHLIFTNFKWSKTLSVELSLVQSPHLSSFPISIGSQSIHE